MSGDDYSYSAPAQRHMLGRIRYSLLKGRAAAFLLGTEIMLRLRGVRGTHRFLTALARGLTPGKPRQPDPELGQQIADAVDSVVNALPVFPSQCLSRALVLHYFLLRYRQSPEFCLGVQTATGHFRAHAWIELDGKELNEAHPAKTLYRPLAAEQLKSAMENDP